MGTRHGRWLEGGEFAGGLGCPAAGVNISDAIKAGQPVKAIRPEDCSWATYSTLWLLTGALH